jgi:hypothetical protein
MELEKDRQYFVYITGVGWTRFTYDGTELKSDYALYRNPGGTSSGGAANMVIYPSDVGSYLIQKYAEGKAPDGSGLLTDVPRLTVPRKGQMLRAVLEDPLALIIYNAIQGALPFMDCMGTLTDSIYTSQIAAQKAQLRKSEKGLQDKQQMQDILDEIRDSFFYKMINSPWFGFVIAILAIAIAIIFALLTIFSAGTALVVFAIVCVLIVAVALSLVVGISAAVANHHLKELKESFGDISPAVEQAFKDMKTYLTVAAWSMIGAIVLLFIASMIGGYTAGKNFLNQQAAGKAKEGDDMGAIMGAAGNAGKGASSTIKGVNQIALAVYELAEEKFKKAVAVNAAEADQWAAQSTYYSKLLERFQKTLTGLWDHIEQLFKSQSDLIKSAGEVSLAIVGNIAI